MDEFFPQPPPIERPQPAPRGSSLPWLIWLLAMLAVMWLLPNLIERIEFAMVRGRERAQMEVARAQLLESPALGEISRQSAAVAKAIGPSVVHVNTVQSYGPGRSREQFAQYLGGPRPEQEPIVGQGSGVVVDTEGYVLTNYHVVEGAQEIQVKLSDTETRLAEVVGLDPLTDLAVLKIPSGGLLAADWADSDTLQVGSLVWAVGNPFGLDRSVTFGIISAKNRRVERNSPYQDFLQTDAAVNPGNSGGPLVDGTGRIVGINTAIVGPAYRGVSFSIPSNMARDVYNRLKASGKVERGYLGVWPADVTPEIARSQGLTSQHGALVRDVYSDTPAKRAGIEIGDVIVEWNGQPVSDRTALQLLVGSTKVGTKAIAVFYRDGAKQTAEITVDELPPQQRRRRG